MSAATNSTTASIVTIAALARMPSWVAWQTEVPPGRLKPTKVPYSPHDGGKAACDNPQTWGIRHLAEIRAANLSRPYLTGGVGLVLSLSDSQTLRIGGVDLDTCLDSGELTPWAKEVIERFGTYAEISPSGTGVKLFFIFNARHVDELRAMKLVPATGWGRRFSVAANGTAHPPGIEVYLGNRFFAVTDQRLDGAPEELRSVPLTDLLWLLKEAGPALKGKQEKAGKGGGGHDNSRSGVAFRTALGLRRAGRVQDLEELKVLLRSDPFTSDWANEVDERQWERLWENTTDGVSLTDFYAYMQMHNYIHAPTRSTWPAASVNSRLPAVVLTDAQGQPILDDKGNKKAISSAAWLDKHQPVEQMTWAPGLPMIIRDRVILEGGWVNRADSTVFNLYRPPEEIHGDPDQAAPWVDHLRFVYPDDAEHIIDWLAHRVQRPGDKLNHALVLGGPQGIGKDSLLEPVKHAVGPWNFREANPKQVGDASMGSSRG